MKMFMCTCTVAHGLHLYIALLHLFFFCVLLLLLLLFRHILFFSFFLWFFLIFILDVIVFLTWFLFFIKFGWFLFSFFFCHFFGFNWASFFNKDIWVNLFFSYHILSSYFSIILPFSILPLFHPSHQMDLRYFRYKYYGVLVQLWKLFAYTKTLQSL